MLYDYPKSEISEIKVSVWLMGEGRAIKWYRFSFLSKVRTGCPTNDEVSGVYFEPKVEPRRPPTVLLHSWLTNRPILPIYSHFAKMIATSGSPCILPALPYHLDRTPKNSLSGARFLRLNPSETLRSFRQAVVDVRSCLDWLEQRYGYHEFSIVGISLGAILACVCMGVEPRLKRSVFILGGGDVGEIVGSGLTTFFIRKKARVGLDENRQSQLLDPLTFAHLIRHRKVLMINARFDPVIPRKSTMKLWHALGEPPIIWLPSTHITSCIFYAFIVKKTVEFLKFDGGVRCS